MTIPPLFPRLPHLACTVTIKVTHRQEGWDSHLLIDKLGRTGEIDCPNRSSLRKAVLDAITALDETGHIGDAS